MMLPTLMCSSDHPKREITGICVCILCGIHFPFNVLPNLLQERLFEIIAAKLKSNPSK